MLIIIQIINVIAKLDVIFIIIFVVVVCNTLRIIDLICYVYLTVYDLY